MVSEYEQDFITQTNVHLCFVGNYKHEGLELYSSGTHKQKEREKEQKQFKLLCNEE